MAIDGPRGACVGPVETIEAFASGECSISNGAGEAVKMDGNLRRGNLSLRAASGSVHGKFAAPTTPVPVPICRRATENLAESVSEARQGDK